MRYMKIKDIKIGQKIERWTILKIEPPKRLRRAFCRCTCGSEKWVLLITIANGKSKSCGCLHREEMSKTFKKHGKWRSRAYHAWESIVQRCKNRNNKQFKNYGKRGIGVCDRWLSFENFYKDMGDPQKGMSIDRVNNNGDYEPSNCRWATNKEQNRNKRTNVIIEYHGQKRCVQDWAEITGIHANTIHQRMKKRWPLTAVFSKEKFKGGRFRKNFHD